jgi:hypothetical protein
MGLDRSVVPVEGSEQAVNARFRAAARNIRQLTDIEAK